MLQQKLYTINKNIWSSIISRFGNFVRSTLTSLPVITLNFIYKMLISFSFLPCLPLSAAIFIAYYNNLIIAYMDIKSNGKFSKYIYIKLIISTSMTLSIFYLGFSLFGEVVSLLCCFTLGTELIFYNLFYFFSFIPEGIWEFWLKMNNFGQGGLNNPSNGGGSSSGGGPPGGGNNDGLLPDPNTLQGRNNTRDDTDKKLINRLKGPGTRYRPVSSGSSYSDTGVTSTTRTTPTSNTGATSTAIIDPTSSSNTAYHPIGSEAEPISLKSRGILKHLSPGWKEIESGFMLVSAEKEYGSSKPVNRVTCFIPQHFWQARPDFLYSPNNYALNNSIADMLTEYKSGVSQAISREIVGENLWRYIQSAREYRGLTPYSDTIKGGHVSDKLLSAIRGQNESNN